MVTKTASSSASRQQAKISGTRAGRLYRLLKVLSEGASTRPQLLKKLKVGMRTFYRDLDLLRERGVNLQSDDNGYLLVDPLETALHSVPFPDPELTFGDVVALTKGKTASHAKLKKAFDNIVK